MSTDTTTTTYVKGTWQETLNKSATLLDRSTDARKKASAMLWTGAQVAIEEWLPTASDDVTASENLYNEVLDILGTSRKGDASKIKTVATAVRNNGLVLADHANLSKAYAEATRLTKTVKAQADEDDAAEKATEAIVAPKTAGTAESAALILLSRGVDGAVVAILDALGADNEAAHRSFMRAVSTEIAARVQAKKPKPVAKAGPKDGATQAKANGKGAAKAAPAKAKAKPASTKAKPVAAKAAPVAAKAKPVAKPASEKGEPVSEPVPAGDDTPENAVSTPEVAAKPVRRAVPVRKGAAVTS